MKFCKKILAVFVAVMMGCFTSIFSLAAEITDDDNVIVVDNATDEELVLISDETYKLDDGWLVTVKGYTDVKDSENGISTLSTGTAPVSGYDFYKYYYKFTRSAYGQTYDWLEMWVWGTFKWDTAKDTVYVVGYGSDINVLISTGVIVSDTNTVYKDNQGFTFLWGKRYGVIYRTVVMHNGSKLNNTFTLWLDVNVNGEVNCNPSAAVQVEHRES